MPRHKGYIETPLAQRFWAKVEKIESGCWVWTGGIGSQGYGHISVGGRSGGLKLAHRISYEMHIGPIPIGLEIDHLCRNRRCVNPAHLEAVTHQVNNLRGIGAAAQCAKKTHCIRGHEFSPDNTLHLSRGERVCRTCQHERNKKGA